MTVLSPSAAKVSAPEVSIIELVVPVGWTVDTLGWKGTSGGITVRKIVDRVLGSLQPGWIVSCTAARTPTTIPRSTRLPCRR